MRGQRKIKTRREKTEGAFKQLSADRKLKKKKGGGGVIKKLECGGEVCRS